MFGPTIQPLIWLCCGLWQCLQLRNNRYPQLIAFLTVPAADGDAAASANGCAAGIVSGYCPYWYQLPFEGRHAHHETLLQWLQQVQRWSSRLLMESRHDDSSCLRLDCDQLIQDAMQDALLLHDDHATLLPTIVHLAERRSP